MARKLKGPLSRRTGDLGRIRGPRGFRFRGGSVFNMRVDTLRSYFFDRVDWDEVLNPAELRALHFVGYILRKQARSLIRTRKKPSRKGSSPTNWQDTLKKGKFGIQSGVDPDTMTVLIGALRMPYKAPYKLIGQPTVPAILELGGRIWFARPAYPNPPRVRKFLPAGRVVKLAPRPYMSKAYDQKKKKVLSVFEDMLGKSPAAIAVARRKNAQYESKGAN